MTAATKERVRPAPQFLLRIFWAIHRAIYRVTGGRIRLSRPQAGKRFGMIRLTTVGRRSGQRRKAMIGYYPDSQNLVTLAMNGWGEAEPAWWLNLLAQPDATVDMPNGQRAVRAREAVGAERDRLWTGFRDYPGWVTSRLSPDIGRGGRPWSCSSLAEQSRASSPHHWDLTCIGNGYTVPPSRI